MQTDVDAHILLTYGGNTLQLGSASKYSHKLYHTYAVAVTSKTGETKKLVIFVKKNHRLSAPFIV